MSADIDTESNDFKAGVLFALAECQRQSDHAHIYELVAEAVGLTFTDAERLMDGYDLPALREVFSCRQCPTCGSDQLKSLIQCTSCGDELPLEPAIIEEGEG